MLTKAAYVVSQFCIKLRKGKKKKSFSAYFLAFLLYPSNSPSGVPLHSSSHHPPPLKVFIATGVLYLPSNGTIWFIGWGWLKDPLLLLWRQCRVQRDDFHITNFRPHVVDLPLDSFAGFINFLKDESMTINPCATGGCKYIKANKF